MKKLMMFASVVMAACVLNAAQYAWGFGAGDYEDINGNRDDTYGVYTGGKVFLYLGTVTASETAFNLTSATLLNTATFDADMYTYGNQDTSALSSSDLITSTAAGQAYSLIMVDKNVATLDGYEGNYVLYSGTSGEQAIPGATVTYYATFQQNDNPIAASDWATMGPVPEPTSGLLLLLGMASLALKRKRA